MAELEGLNVKHRRLMEEWNEKVHEGSSTYNRERESIHKEMESLHKREHEAFKRWQDGAAVANEGFKEFIRIKLIGKLRCDLVLPTISMMELCIKLIWEKKVKLG